MKKIKLLIISIFMLIISYNNSFSQIEPFIGQISTFGFNFEPQGWAKCDGQLLQISQYSALFALIGTTYGGDGQTTFALPDLRGRVPIHQGTGPGLSNRTIGERAGSQSVTLTTANLPSHNHSINVSSAVGNTASPSNAYLSKGTGREKIYSTTSNTLMNAGATAMTGSGTALSIMNPYLIVNFCIALEGVFPSRN